MNNPTVVILATATDTHAMVVARALQHLEAKYHQLDFRSFPQHSSISYELTGNQSALAILQDQQQIDLKAVNSIWFRRDVQPQPHTSLSGSDKNFARQECSVLISGIEAAASQASWINPRRAAMAAENKILQLEHAAALGMQIPATLMSNDPMQIRRFVQQQPTVYKSASGFVWHDEAERKATYTRHIQLADLQNDNTLQQCPGIFQALIEPDFEVRLLLLGCKALAIQIQTTQVHPQVRDWRLQQHRYVKAKPIDVPPTIVEQCQRLLSSMSLLTASFDFIVDQQGNWYFLELNQAGQFLFLEEWCPELPVLATFCQFLLNPSSTESQLPTRTDVKLAQFYQYLQPLENKEIA